MIFWTIVFFAITLQALLFGGLFKSLSKNLKQIELKKLNGGSEKEHNEEWVKAGCFPLVVLTFLVVAEVIYLVNAIGHDTYKYPTIAAIFLLIIGFIKPNEKKNLKTMTEDEITIYKADLIKKDKRTFLSVLRSFLWVSYFAYMFYILVF